MAFNRASHRLRGPSSRLVRRSGVAASAAELMEVVLDPDRCHSVAENAVLVTLTSAGQREVPIASAHGLCVADLEATRRPLSHSGMSSYIGYCPVPSSRGRRSVWFESFNELNHLRELIICNRAQEIATQPFLIVWRLASGELRHTPDILATHAGGRTCLYDIKSVDAVSEAVIAQAAMTAATAAVAGWDYELRTDLPLQRARNLACLHNPQLVEEDRVTRWRERLASCRWPLSLEAVARRLEDGPDGRAAVMWLVSQGSLHLDLNQPITPDSLIAIAPIEKAGSPWIVEI